MNKITRAICIVVVGVLICGGIFAVAFRSNSYPFPNFERDGRFAGGIACDNGTTIFKTYDGPQVRFTVSGIQYTHQAYTGIIISVRGSVRYFVFSPNPTSMSPITFSYRPRFGWGLKEVSQQERDADIQKNMPNLYSEFIDEKNDCVDTK